MQAHARAESVEGGVAERLAGRWSFRLRIFLFFSLVAIGGVAIVVAALTFGYMRRTPDAPEAGFITAGVVAAFGLAALTAWVWMLFDEHVAKPIAALAGSLRAAAHADATAVDLRATRFLGDLAPAANAAAAELTAARTGLDDAVGERTAALLEESVRLGEALRDAPVGLLITDAVDHRVALYNPEAMALLRTAGLVADPERLGLDRPLFDAVAAPTLRERVETLREERAESGQAQIDLPGGARLCAEIRRMSRIGDPLGEGMSIALFDPDAAPLTLRDDAAPSEAYHDLSLLARPAPKPTADALLDRLSYVVFDTETTGLEPSRDEIVQIAATRVVNGRPLYNETFETLVDPERDIPAKSTEIHKIRPEDVAGAPTIDVAGARLRRYCEGAVLVAHNAPFDLAFFHKHQSRIGAAFDMPVLDTVLLSAVLFEGDSDHSLDGLAARFGVEIPPEDRHTARGDTLATAEILLKMIPMLAARGFPTLGQAQAAAERQKALKSRQKAQTSV